MLLTGSTIVISQTNQKSQFKLLNAFYKLKYQFMPMRVKTEDVPVFSVSSSWIGKGNGEVLSKSGSTSTKE